MALRIRRANHLYESFQYVIEQWRETDTMGTIRVADYITTTLADSGLDTAFAVTGGMAMHMNDALGAEKRIRTVYCHNEQAATHSAEGYAHISMRPALVSVTAGPGAINALTGVFGAFVDSMPMLVIAGQARKDLLRSSYHLDSIRQIGEQETDSVALARNVCKYARRIDNPERIRFELEKALHLAVTGRPGPCWLEIPLDVQASMIDPGTLVRFRHAMPEAPDLCAKAESLVERWKQAKRPLLVVGPGVREDHASASLETALTRLGCPVVGAGPIDSITNDHPQYAGRIGTLGTRAGNLAVQNADLIVFVGMRCYLGLVTYNWPMFGRHAHKVVVDDDVAEFDKPCQISDEAVVAGARHFLDALGKAAASFDGSRHARWLSDCRARVNAFPPVSDTMRHVREDGRINPYWFTEELFARLRRDDVIAACNASSSIIPLQAGWIREGQRFFSNLGSGAMGFGLPAAIGAATVPGVRRVIGLVGDGSLMMNIQELQTLSHLRLPVILVIYENDGYVSIIQSQRNFFHRESGCGPLSGVTCPDFCRVAEAFGLPAVTVSGADFQKQLDSALSVDGPLVVVARLDPDQGFEPKVAARRLPDGRMVSSYPEDMSPFLPRDELNRHLVHPLEDE